MSRNSKQMQEQRDFIAQALDRLEKESQEEGFWFPEPFPGLMEEAVKACLDISHKEQPELALMAVLSGMAAACGSFYYLSDGTRLNLYCLGVARTCAGKDKPLRFAKKIGTTAKAKLIGKPASGQGLEDALASPAATYCAVDEIAHFFALMNGAKASSYERANAAAMLELWPAGCDSYPVRDKAGKESRVVKNPAFNLLGFTTPEKLGNAFTPDDFADGLAGRLFIVLSGRDPELKRVKKPLELPKNFKKRIEDIAGKQVFAPNGGIEVTATPKADEELEDLLNEFDKVVRTTESPYERALCGRSAEKLERVAGVLAVLSNPAKPVITIDMVDWAAQWVRATNLCALTFVDAYVHGGEDQENAAKLLRMIADGKTRPESSAELAAHKAGWVSKSALLRRSKMSAKKEFHPAIAQLTDCGKIEEHCFEGMLWAVRASAIA